MPAPARAAHVVDGHRLARAVGLLAIVASAVDGQYGAGINFVAVQSMGLYPAVGGFVPLAMLATGLLLLPRTHLYARFSAALPRAGWAYVWIGRSLGVPAGFVVCFLWWVAVTASMGFIAFACSDFLATALAGLGVPAAALLAPGGRIGIGLAAIWAIFGVHAAGVGSYGRFATVLLVLVLATAGVIIGYGFATPPAHFVALVTSRTHLALPTAAPAAASPGAFLAVCTLLVFAYAGISAAPALGGESRDPSRSVPRGVVIGWLVAVVLYTLVTGALFHAAPWWVVEALIGAGHAAFATAPGLVSLLAPHWLGVTLQLAVAVIVGKTLAPQMLSTSRLAFAWAEDGLLPEVFARTSARRVPVPALLLTASLASLFLLQSVLVGWALGVVIRALSLLLVWLLLAIGALRLAFGPAPEVGHWGVALAAERGVIVAAMLSIPITLGLIAAVAVLPGTPWMFQPLLQSAAAMAIAFALLGIAAWRAQARGLRLDAIARSVPPE
jgi:basic amino acid/polyamine antiporter, APA family